MTVGVVGLARFALAAFLLVVGPASAVGQTSFPLPITTGGVTGIYYQIGAAICRLLRDHPLARPIDCQTEGSAGSVANVRAVAAGQMPLGLAQSDTLYDVATGTGAFAGVSPDNRVRALFSPVVETFIVLASERNWVPQIADLRGRRINIGAPASGTEVAFRRIMAERGWSSTDFADLSGIRASLQGQALCAGRVDAVAFVSANPVPVIQDAAFACDARFVPFDAEFARSMVERYPYYVAAYIPGGFYRNNPDPTQTIGVRGVVIGSVVVPDEVVYAITRTVFEHLPELRTLHLAFSHVTAAEMLDQCVFVPVHPGAARYYREASLPMPRRCLPL